MIETIVLTKNTVDMQLFMIRACIIHMFYVYWRHPKHVGSSKFLSAVFLDHQLPMVSHNQRD